jgi:hypothetical protein
MNINLLLPFTGAEVNTALDQMHPLKSPEPDGFSAEIFQEAWPMVGDEVTRVVLSFLNGSVFDTPLNATNIVLIPKVANPSKVTDYRPISLCNVLYKLIAKVLANRLKVVLPHVISPEQSAFIPRRLISDNILVAFETLHTMDTRLKGKEGFMALKLDMSKAYDSGEWDFLEAMLLKMGFANRWVNLIMVCVRSVSYSIILNGQPHGTIVPTRGIRQGDPLSPYLFIICVEAMSCMLHRAQLDGLISSIPTSRSGPRINHLFFADNSLLFCRANTQEWRHI